MGNIHQTWYCHICQRPINSESWMQHKNAKRHRNKAKLRGLDANLEPDPVVPSNTHTFCTICQLSIATFRWHSHIHGRSHWAKEWYASFKSILDEAGKREEWCGDWRWSWSGYLGTSDSRHRKDDDPQNIAECPFGEDYSSFSQAQRWLRGADEKEGCFTVSVPMLLFDPTEVMKAFFTDSSLKSRAVIVKSPCDTSFSALYSPNNTLDGIKIDVGIYQKPLTLRHTAGILRRSSGLRNIKWFSNFRNSILKSSKDFVRYLLL